MTKPTEQPELWASDPTYTSGPKAGQNTKAMSEAGAAAQGHIPGSLFPTTANEFNVFDHKVSALCRWLFAGRFDKMADAHVVETDSNGLLSARAADFGDPGQPGPSLSVINSNSDWTANIQATDHEGLRVQGIFSPGQGQQLFYVDTTMDDLAKAYAAQIRCSASPSCGGLTINSAATGTISGQDALAALRVNNEGGVAAQFRASSTINDAVRIINTTNQGLSLKVGFGNLETFNKNLQGTAIEARGGDGDTSNPFGNAGYGAILRGGDFALGANNIAAGYGLLAFSGQSDVGAPGGAAINAVAQGGYASAIEATHAAGGAVSPVINVQTLTGSANAVQIDCDGTGAAVYAEFEEGTGLYLDPQASGGGFYGSPIRMIAQPQNPVSLANGSIWTRSKGSHNELMRAPAGGTDAYILDSNHPQCYARSQVFIAEALATNAVDENLGASFGWSIGRDPLDGGGTCRVTLYGRTSVPYDLAYEILFEVIDVTDGNAVILRAFHKQPNLGDSTVGSHSVTMSNIYTVPASGPRTFQVRYTGNTGGLASQSFWGYVEIEQVQA